MNSTDQVKQCLYCNKPLKGRTDKKFCDDACRNAFHNNLNSPKREVINPIVNILKKNRAILLDFLSKGQTNQISREEMLKAGYDFQYYTEYMRAAEYDLFFCFDVGIKAGKHYYDFHYRIEFLKDPPTLR